MTSPVTLGYVPCAECGKDATVHRENRTTRLLYYRCPDCKSCQPRSNAAQQRIIREFKPLPGDDRPVWEILGLEPPVNDEPVIDDKESPADKDAADPPEQKPDDPPARQPKKAGIFSFMDDF